MRGPLSSRQDAPSGLYGGLARVSPGCPPPRGRLATCYSAVRRWENLPEGRLPARLAWLRHAASVSPEPGSNPPWGKFDLSSRVHSSRTMPPSFQRPIQLLGVFNITVCPSIVNPHTLREGLLRYADLESLSTPSTDPVQALGGECPSAIRALRRTGTFLLRCVPGLLHGLQLPNAALLLEFFL